MDQVGVTNQNDLSLAAINQTRVCEANTATAIYTDTSFTFPKNAYVALLNFPPVSGRTEARVFRGQGGTGRLSLV